MYVPDHLKLRIALARQLKAFYYEDGNSSRNRKRIYRAYGKYLGTTYDTFLNYLKEGKYDLSGIKLAPHIVATTALLEPIRTACERLYARTPYGRFPRSPPRFSPSCTRRPKRGSRSGSSASTDPDRPTAAPPLPVPMQNRSGTGLSAENRVSICRIRKYCVFLGHLSERCRSG
ncbi:MAG: hypothetical protein SPH60_07835 [Alistipes senegalensis]|nr:hypothetical protein [Alistipes senegalensis]